MTTEPTITKVHEDSRGEMYSILLSGDRELMLLHSKAGSLRGGHSHDVPESIMVLTGKMHYSKRNPVSGFSHRDFLTEGDCSYNPSAEIHMGDFPEDTWLIEWKHAKKGEWKNENYGPWREKVDANARS